MEHMGLSNTQFSENLVHFFFPDEKKGVGICWRGQRLHLTCSWGSVGQLQSIAHQEAAGKKSQQRGTKHVLPP